MIRDAKMLATADVPHKALGGATPIPMNWGATWQHPPSPRTDCLRFEPRDGDTECFMACGLLSLIHSFLILITVICSKVAGLGLLVLVTG